MKKKTFYLFSLMVLMSFFSYGLMVTQIQRYMNYLGLSLSEIAAVVSISSIIAMIGQITFGYLSDRYKTIRKIYRWFTIIFMITGTLVYSLQTDNIWLRYIEICLMVPFTTIFQSVVESWIIQNNQTKAYFGRIRVFGSLGWALGALASGYLVDLIGYRILGFFNLGISVFLCLLTLSLSDANKENEEEIHFSDVSILLRSSSYLLLIVIFTCIHMLINVDSLIVNELFVRMKATANDIGLYAALYAGCEIPTMLAMDKIYSALGPKKTAITGALSIGIKFVMLAFAMSVFQIQLTNFCQLFAYPFILVSQKFMIARVVPPHLQSTGQSVADAVFTGLSAIFSPFLASALIQTLSVKATLLIFSSFALLAIVLLLFFNTNKKYIKNYK
ncbi:MAG: MFS transporter [Traorella sp.]